MHQPSKIFGFCLTVLSFLHAAGQLKTTGQPEIHNFSKSEYRGGTQTWNIGQGSNKNMYFANNSGLLEFDGNFWKLYPVPQNRGMRALKVVGEIIYIGGYNEFGIFAPDEKGVLHYKSLSALLPKEEQRLIDNIWKIHEMGSQIIFQAFDHLYVYEKGKLRVLDPPGKFQFSFPYGKDVLIQDIDHGLYRFNGQNLAPLSGTSILNGTEIWGILPVSGKMLIATLDKGAFLYDGRNLKSWDSEINTELLRNSCLGVSVIRQHGKNYLLFNTVLNGLIITDEAGHVIQRIHQKNGLQNNTVLSSFVDAQGNLWLGLDNGISLINESSAVTFFGSNYNLSTVYASAVHRGKLYVATNQGLFYQDWGDGLKDAPFLLVTGTTGQAWNVQVFDDQVWCSHNRGLMQISGTSPNIIDPIGYWGVKPIPGRPGIFIGSTYNGFNVLAAQGGSLRRIATLEGIPKGMNTFEVDAEAVWLKKDNSLYRCLLSEDLKRFRSIRIIDRMDARHVGTQSIQRINGELTFLSHGQFFKYDADEQLFRKIPGLNRQFQEIPDLKSVTEDDKGNLWFHYRDNLGEMRKSGSGYTTRLSEFAPVSGLLVPDYVSILNKDNADVFIGMTNGLAHFDPKSTTEHPNPVSVIRSFSHNGDSLALGRMRNRNDVEVPYRFNNVRFTFSAPEYENLGHIQFSYRLVGFDDSWSSWSNKTDKEYTNLHEGDYRMEVRVRSPYGAVSKADGLDFSVRPPWYRHWIAYVLYLIILVFLFIYVRQRVSSHIRRNKYFETIEQRRIYLEKEAKIRQEQLELEKQVEQLKNEKLRTKILNQDKELVNNSLQVVKQNKILTGIIDKIKEIDADRLDETARFQLGKVNKIILKEMNSDRSWKDLEKHIRNVHFDFLKRLKERFPAITPRELDLSTYLLMNMSTKEIAEIMNISSGGVELARYRLRKKLGLEKQENLTGFLMAI